VSQKRTRYKVRMVRKPTVPKAHTGSKAINAILCLVQLSEMESQAEPVYSSSRMSPVHKFCKVYDCHRSAYTGPGNAPKRRVGRDVECSTPRVEQMWVGFVSRIEPEFFVERTLATLA
jgi:hypothetical protein